MNTAPTTREKVLRINVDSAKHGTFAEIGAGQEVARWFFHVGGAAGTVAKSISAYDMAVSDALYGHTDRYVSRERLTAMLTQEFDAVVRQLEGHRPAETSFFAFADTMATRSFSRHADGHGWMGVRFQHRAGSPPSDVMLHVFMCDTENVREQEAIGRLGVNLLHGALYAWERPEELIGELMDGLASGRIEIDFIRMSGPAFDDVDNRLMLLQLLVREYTGAVMFARGGEVLQPSDALYKRPVIVERGNFRPVTTIAIDLLEAARREFGTHTDGESLVLLEMTLRNLLHDGAVDHTDFLSRVDVLGVLGYTVMISRFGTYHALATYLRRHTTAPIGFALGIPVLRELFDPKYYRDLEGGILEGFGRLFGGNTTAYVYPSREGKSGKRVTLNDLVVDPSVRDLYAYLCRNERMVSVEGVDESRLHVQPGDVLAQLQAGDHEWEKMVPEAAVDLIRKQHLFGVDAPPGKSSR